MMTKEAFIQLINIYFQYLVGNYMVFYTICNCFPLKINKKRAYIIALIYANYMPITDALSAVIVGGGLTPYTSFVYILLKINIFVEAFLFLLFIILYVDREWFRAFWLATLLPVVQYFPFLLYVNRFVLYDSMNGITIFPVSMGDISYYTFIIFLNVVWAIILIPIWKRLCNNKIIGQISKWNWYIFYACFVLLLVFSEKDYFEDNNTIKGISNYKNVIIYIFVMIVILLISINLIEKRRLKIENMLLTQHKKLQYTNYLAFANQEQELLNLYYEIGDYINSIQDLLNKGEHHKAEDYTKTLAQQFKSFHREFYCNHKVINAVVSAKAKTCNQNKIILQSNLKLPEELLVRDLDLMCMFSNLLDNAIEGCLRYPVMDRYINISTSIVGCYLVVKVINSKSDKDIVKKHITWKKDKKLHGYGLRILEEIVEQYEGQMEVIDQGDNYNALVMLKAVALLE